MKSPHMHSNTTFFVLFVVAMFLYLIPATHTQWENEWYVMFGPPFSTLSHEWIRYRVFSFFVFLSFCVTSFFSVLVKVLLKRYVLLPFCYLPKIMYQKKYAHCSLPTMFFCVCGVACVINSVDSTRERKCCFFHENIAAIFETIKMQPLWNSTGIIIIAWIFNCIRMMWVQTRLTSTHSWHIVGCSWLSPCRSETMEMVARVRFWRFTSLNVQHAVKLREVINKTPPKRTKIY